MDSATYNVPPLDDDRAAWTHGSYKPQHDVAREGAKSGNQAVGTFTFTLIGHCLAVQRLPVINRAGGVSKFDHLLYRV